jgi:hypothetical protein
MNAPGWGGADPSRLLPSLPVSCRLFLPPLTVSSRLLPTLLTASSRALDGATAWHHYLELCPRQDFYAVNITSPVEWSRRS